MQYNAETLLIRSQDTGEASLFAEVTPERAGWKYLNMTAYRLNAGQIYDGNTADAEFVHVILGGMCHIKTSRGTFANVGRRPNVFSGMPYALYLPRRTDYEIEAITDHFEVASCWVETDEDHPIRLITPKDSSIELRGGGNASRQINSIIPPGFD